MVDIKPSTMKKTLANLELLIQMFEKSMEDSRIKLNPVAKQTTRAMIKSIEKNKNELNSALLVGN